MRFDVNAEEARLEYSPSSWQYFAHFLQLMAILALPLILSAGSRLRRRGSRAIPEAPLITMEDR